MADSGSEDECFVNDTSKAVIWKDISFFKGSTAITRKHVREDPEFEAKGVSKRSNIDLNTKKDCDKSVLETQSWNNILFSLKKDKILKQNSHPYSKSLEVLPQNASTDLPKYFMKANKVNSPVVRLSKHLPADFQKDSVKPETCRSKESIQIRETSHNQNSIRDRFQNKNNFSKGQNLKGVTRNPITGARKFKPRISPATFEDRVNDFRRSDSINKTPVSSYEVSTKITVQVSSIDGNTFKDFMMEKEIFAQVKRNNPRLYMVLPDLQMGYKKLSYSADALILLLGHVFPSSSTWGRALLHWRVVLETFSMANLLNMNKLQELCMEYFSHNPISHDYMQEFCDIAHQLGVLKDLERFMENPDGSCEFQPNKRSFQRFCSVTVSIYVEPSEFKLPLHLNTTSGKTSMESAFARDIKNEILIKSVSGQFCITGVQLRLNPTPEDMGDEVHIICEALNRQENLSWEENRVKNMNSLLIFNFRRKKLAVKAGQEASLNITIEDLKPRNCCSGREATYHHKTCTGSFRVALKSNKRVPDSDEKRFFIEKLFYTMT